MEVRLIAVARPECVVPWENIRVPYEVDGSHGTFRAPKSMCALEATNDYQAIGARFEQHEAAETQRVYRREAKHLLLWAIIERGKAVLADKRGRDRLSRLLAPSRTKAAPKPGGSRPCGQDRRPSGVPSPRCSLQIRSHTRYQSLARCSVG